MWPIVVVITDEPRQHRLQVPLVSTPPALAVPADHGLGPHHRYVLSPSAGPQVTEPDPENAVGLAEARAGIGPEEDLKLVAQGEILEGQVTVRPPECEEGSEGDEKQPKHAAEYQPSTPLQYPVAYSDSILPPYSPR